MDLSTAQARLYAGYGKLTAKLGAPCAWYRPSGPNQPLTSANLQPAPVQARFDPDPSFSTLKVNGYNKPQWYGAFDATDTQPGDYLVTPDGQTFFIACQQAMVAPLVVQSNMNVSFNRPVSATGSFGPGYYSGNTLADGDGTPLATGWPVSFLQGSRGEKATLNLAQDGRAPYYNILAPAIPGVTLKTNDLLIDGLGRRFISSEVELTDLGYRLTAILSTA